MTEERIVVSLRATKGNKYEETKECIASYNWSIVFLPRDVDPGDIVRVRLIPIGKNDRNGKPMYRGVLDAIDLLPEELEWVSKEAEELRSGTVLETVAATALFRTMRVTPGESFPYYYLHAGKVYGSRFSPATLLPFTMIGKVDERGLIRLLLWATNPQYYAQVVAGQSIEEPELSEEALSQFRTRIAREERVLSEEATAKQ